MRGKIRRLNLGKLEKLALLQRGYDCYRRGEAPNRDALIKSIDYRAAALTDMYIDTAYTAELEEYILQQQAVEQRAERSRIARSIATSSTP